MAQRLLSIGAFIAMLACGGDSTLELSVDLRTDYVAGIEFAGARLIIDGDRTEEALTGSDSFVEGRRLFDLDGLDRAERRTLRVELLTATGRVVTSRDITVRHQEDMAVTVVITRDCSAVVCDSDQSCLAGRCVDQGCTDGTGELCEEPDCTTGSDCPMLAACSQATCQEGLCLYDVVECDEGLYCAPESGCVPIPVEEEDMGVSVDMGAPVDMSVPTDMGPTIRPFPDCPFVREGTFEVPSDAPPNYLDSVLDRVFETKIIRATDRSEEPIAVPPGEHRWSDPNRHPGHTRHAWNADESAIYVESGRDGVILDPQLRPFVVTPFDTEATDSVWHPRERSVRLVAADDRLLGWDIRTATPTTIAEFPGYRNLAIGSGRGRMSDDGETIVLDGLDVAGTPVAFVFDLRTRTKLGEIKVDTPSGYRWSTISPSGEYLVIVWDSVVVIHDREGRVVGEPWTSGRLRDFDLMLDRGTDIAIGFTTGDFPEVGDGLLARRPLEGTPDLISTQFFGAPHGTVSARATALPEWVFVSFRTATDSPYRGEVIAVHTRSGDVRRLAHTHDENVGDVGGTRASPTRDGRQIAFTSDWDGRTAVFVIDTEPVCEL